MPGAIDSNGIYQYAEDDVQATFSDLLNLLAGSTSTEVGDLDARVAAIVAARDAAWTTYTPVLGNVSLGNGSISGTYRKIGRTVLLDVELLCGSTTSFSGTVTFSLPTAARTGSFGGNGNGTKRVGTTTDRALVTRLNTVTNFYVFEVAGSTVNVLSNTTAIASGTSFRASLQYEAAA